MKRSQQRGMTLVEVMLALAIVTMSFGGLFALLDTTTRIMDNNRRELDATLMAESTIEACRAAPWSNIMRMSGSGELPGGIVHPRSEGRGVTSSVTVVKWAGFDLPEPAPREVTVRVSWKEANGHSRTSTLSTVIGPWGKLP
jgi:prepilin-type N-terminal cleavage/methylation domain-containing protein